MLKPINFANALATVAVAAYMVCMILSAIAPDLIISIGQSWVHTLNLSVARASSPMDLGAAIFGAITFGGLSWVAGYLGAMLYNKFDTTRVLLFNLGIIIVGALLYYLISNR